MINTTRFTLVTKPTKVRENILRDFLNIIIHCCSVS